MRPEIQNHEAFEITHSPSVGQTIVRRFPRLGSFIAAALMLSASFDVKPRPIDPDMNTVKSGPAPDPDPLQTILGESSKESQQKIDNWLGPDPLRGKPVTNLDPNHSLLRRLRQEI
ncbi:MAG: hypothetical protein Q7R49_03970 [Candidatus Daviesbacteria bacterium]|nr:hypothetical protein [Candidatus Daviesbacteria bacterium]